VVRRRLQSSVSLSVYLPVSLSASLAPTLSMQTAGIATRTAIAGMLGEVQPRFSADGVCVCVCAYLCYVCVCVCVCVCVYVLYQSTL